VSTTSQTLAARFLDPAEPRDRVLLAMAGAIEEKGFAATTVADVVRIAKVSRRTFYEHFADRDDCFLELFDATGDWMLRLVGEAAAVDVPWRERVERALDAYLGPMAAQPGLTRSFLFEIYSTGQRGEERRRASNVRFSEQLCALAELARERDPSLNPISFETATAITGGIRELAMLAAEGRSSVEELRAVALQLIGDVLTARRS
jgi:AcrR family transcriptional regulator